MTTIIIISTLLGGCYLVLMLLYRLGWTLQPVLPLPPREYIPRTSISVIIAARNEELNIGHCIDSILAGNYPADLLEIIVVDDHSEDKTADIVNSYKRKNIKCIDLKSYMGSNGIIAYKKAAINTGITHSKGELIITTDADCILPKEWLRLFAFKYETETPVMIVAPVDFISDNRVIHIFQSLDFMSMQGITAASHRLQMGNMSNGANLAFTREAFDAVNGYTGIDHIASGDDYLLMMKLNKAYPGKIGYIKSQNTIAKTLPQPDWNSFLQQRIRWASKSAKYDDKKLNAILIFAYIFNVNFLFMMIEGLFNPVFWSLAFGLFFIKVIADIIFLYPVSVFFHKRHQLIAFLLLQPIHVAYIIVAGFLGFLGNYNWKGRKLK